MTNLIKNFLILIIFNYCTSDQSSWLVPYGSRRIIYFPFQPSLSGEKSAEQSCQHCFHFRTVDQGRRLFVESCGGQNCISVVRHRDLKDDIEPTEDYDLNQCGKIKNNDRSLLNKALQLKMSTSIKNTLRPAEYPWLVRIESRSHSFAETLNLCGGTLIHPQWVITAAHCMFDANTNLLYPPDGIHLYMGHYNRLSTSDDAFITQPALYIIHPKFRISRQLPVPIHDLVLIKLARPAPLSPSIDIACLPESTDKLNDGTLAFTAGWGLTSPDSLVVEEPRKARIRISPRSCRQLMVDEKLHICGRNLRGNNICSGDSGAGLMVRTGIKSTNNQTEWKWHLFGVASFGLDDCSPIVNHDNAFASISIDTDWIREMMKKY